MSSWLFLFVVVVLLVLVLAIGARVPRRHTPWYGVRGEPRERYTAMHMVEDEMQEDVRERAARQDDRPTGADPAP